MVHYWSGYEEDYDSLAAFESNFLCKNQEINDLLHNYQNTLLEEAIHLQNITGIKNAFLQGARYTPMFYETAKKTKNQEIIKLLINRKLCQGILTKDMGMIEESLKAGADIEFQHSGIESETTYSALGLAILSCDLQVLRTIFNKKPDIKCVKIKKLKLWGLRKYSACQMHYQIHYNRTGWIWKDWEEWLEKFEKYN